MSMASKLGKASGLLFLIGLVFSKIRNFPVPIFSVVMNACSLLFYILGYSIWFISSWLYPKYTKKIDAWYGFAEFKEQYLYAAIIGFIATGLSLGAFFMPILVIPAAWLFLISNLMWTFAEYHKLYNPPDYETEFSHTHQEQYLSYAMLMTGVTLIGAVYTTLIFIFPPLIAPLYAITTIIGVGVNILAVEVWLNFTFGDHKPSAANESYTQMHEVLEPNVTVETRPTPAPTPAPYQGKVLFPSAVSVGTELEPPPSSPTLLP